MYCSFQCFQFELALAMLFTALCHFVDLKDLMGWMINKDVSQPLLQLLVVPPESHEDHQQQTWDIALQTLSLLKVGNFVPCSG